MTLVEGQLEDLDLTALLEGVTAMALNDVARVSPDAPHGKGGGGVLDKGLA